MRHTGLHIALALAVPTFIGAWLDVLGLGLGIGVVLAVATGARWPMRPVAPPSDANDG